MKYLPILIGGFLNAIIATILNIPVWIAFIFFVIGLLTIYIKIVLDIFTFKKDKDLKNVK